MKILHLVYRYLPDIGGIEVYVNGLVPKLKERGYDSIVTFPSTENNSYIYDDTRVEAIRVAPEIKQSKKFYNDTDKIFENDLRRIIKYAEPNIIHIHNSNTSIVHMTKNIAKQYNIPLVMTTHGAAFICMTNHLLRWGTDVCDGIVDIKKCTACTLNRNGANRTLSEIFSNFPSMVGMVPDIFDLRGGIWTGLRMKQLVRKRKKYIFNIINGVEVIIVINRWMYDVYVRNGIPENKLRLVRLGINNHYDMNQYGEGNNGKLKLVFMGRFVREKGAEILINALKELPESNLELDIYGVSVSHKVPEKRVRELAGEDPRVNIMPEVNNNDVIRLLGNYDYLIVPSQTVEGGPLILLEAFAAGIPVIGSDLGAINEHVKHEYNGLLVRHDSVRQWSDTLGRVAGDRNLHEKLKKNVKPPRTMNEVANDMVKIYKELMH